jgi:hypothetical protein
MARGKDAQAVAALKSHVEFTPDPSRDPVGLLLEQEKTRDAFDQAIADFAEKYADQNERDYAALQAAVKNGRVETTTDI